MHDYDVQTTLSDLGRAFEEFKATNDERLRHVERKGHSDPLLDQKLERLDEVIQKAEDKTRRLQMASARTLRSEGDDDDGRASLFMDYVRKGIDAPLVAWDQKSLSTSSDPDGGYLVPHGLDSRMQSILQQGSPLRQLASVCEISTDGLEILLDKDMADIGWVTEAQDRAETKSPQLAKIRIPVHEMYAKPRATQKLLDDARLNVEEWLAEKVAERMAAMENQAFVTGDGAGKPKGFLSYDLTNGNEWGKLESLTTGAKGGFLQGGADLVIDLFHTLKTEYLNGAVWLMSRSAQSAIRKLKDSGSGQYLWQPALDGALTSSLMGHGVHVCDDVPALSSTKATASVVFGNFKQGYQIVDRAGTRILRDPYSAKPYVEFYTTRRVGGDVVNFDALKVLNFSD